MTTVRTPPLEASVRRDYGLGSVATGAFGTVPGLPLLPYLTGPMTDVGPGLGIDEIHRSARPAERAEPVLNPAASAMSVDGGDIARRPRYNGPLDPHLVLRAGSTTGAEFQAVGPQDDSRHRRPVLPGRADEAEPLLDPVGGRHRGLRRQRDAHESQLSRAPDAVAHQRFTDTVALRRGGHGEHPDLGLRRTGHLAKG